MFEDLHGLLEARHGLFKSPEPTQCVGNVGQRHGHSHVLLPQSLAADIESCRTLDANTPYQGFGSDARVAAGLGGEQGLDQSLIRCCSVSPGFEKTCVFDQNLSGQRPVAEALCGLGEVFGCFQAALVVADQPQSLDVGQSLTELVELAAPCRSLGRRRGRA